MTGMFSISEIRPVRAVAAVATTAALALATPVFARSAPESFADLAAELSPSVVNISTTQKVQQGNQSGPGFQFPPGSPFEEFFKDFFERNRPPGGGGQQNRPRRVTSLGSGFVIDKAGLIVTNNHVIAEADEVSVTFPNGDKLPAKILGKDPKTDLALLKVESETPLPAVPWGSSDTARVGDWVVAIGNPFGLGGSVTAGIISARGRDINAGPYDDFIQTDASINRGNSGGPLFNMDGEVIGINTAIFSPTGGSVGIGFAIPATLAQNVIAQLAEFGRTKRGWLGVRTQTVTDEIAESLGLDKASGALVAGISEGGPAEGAGLQQGDVILTFDGKDVSEMRELPRIVAETQIGKEVKVALWRKGEKVEVGVTIGELEDAETKVASADPKAPVEPDTVDTVGMTLSTLTDELRKKYDLADDANGVVVAKVDADGAAAEKGIREGDLIVEVAQEEVKTPGEVLRKVTKVKKSNRKSILLLLERGGDLRFIAVRLDKG